MENGKDLGCRDKKRRRNSNNDITDDDSDHQQPGIRQAGIWQRQRESGAQDRDHWGVRATDLGAGSRYSVYLL